MCESQVMKVCMRNRTWPRWMEQWCWVGGVGLGLLLGDCSAGASSSIQPMQQIDSRELTGKDGAPMVLVPEGEFLYGDENQRLALSAFYMDQYEVTASRYARFLQETGRVKPHKWNEVNLVSDGDRPIIGVTWYDADAYCRYYGKRLPTEQEWEKAARGTDGREYPWGNEEPTSRHANFRKCCDMEGYAALTAAGEHEAGKSPYGIYDMAGNVWEWTSSHYDSSSKVLRGGSWLDFDGLLRTTIRNWGGRTNRWDDKGFRCAQDIDI